MRSGGASLAASLGVPDRLIRIHEGWNSVSSKDRYIKESLPSLHCSLSLQCSICKFLSNKHLQNTKLYSTEFLRTEMTSDPSN